MLNFIVCFVSEYATQLLVVLLLLQPLKLKQKEKRAHNWYFFLLMFTYTFSSADCTKFARTHDKIFKTANEHRFKLHHVFPTNSKNKKNNVFFLFFYHLIQFVLFPI